jgi:K+-transporting ATPase ATPase C chain
MSEAQMRELVQENTDGRDFGIWGQPRVDVMTLNFALDRLAQK